MDMMDMMGGMMGVPMGLGRPMGMDGGMRNKVDEGVRIMGEIVKDEDVVEEFDDALGNFERRVIDFVDLEAVCLRSLYVGNINPDTHEAEVREYFEDYGTMETIDVVRRRNQRPCAYLVFSAAETVDKIQTGRPHVLTGHTVTTKRSLLQKDKRVGFISTNTIRIGAPMTFSYKSMTAGLTNQTSTKDVEEYFTRYFGKVEKVKMDRRDFGAAYITFEDTDVVDKIALLRAFQLSGRSLEAEKVYSETDHLDEHSDPELNITGDPEAKVMRKMFVYNLPRETNNKDLREYFATFGEIEQVEIPRSKSNGKIYGVIVFAKSESVDDVMKGKPHRLEVGRETREMAPKRVVPKGEDKDLRDCLQIKFYARQAFESLSREELEDYFSQFGEVLSVKILSKPDKKMGFVQFHEEDPVMKASLLYLHRFKDREVEVTKALGQDKFREKKRKEQEQEMFEREIMNRRMQFEKMQEMQMQMREKLARGMNKLEQQSGLMGVGGEAGMGARIPQIRPGGGGNPLAAPGRPACVVLEEVSDDLAETKIHNFFNKFGKIRKLILNRETHSGYLYFREENMMDYCVKKTSGVLEIDGHSLKVSKGTEPMPEPDEPSSLLKKWAPQSDPNFLADWETKHRNKSKEANGGGESEEVESEEMQKLKSKLDSSWGVVEKEKPQPETSTRKLDSSWGEPANKKQNIDKESSNGSNPLME